MTLGNIFDDLARGLKPSPDYSFKNGDKVIIGFKIFQVLDNELKHVADFIEVEGQETHYIQPGITFTYEVKS